MFHVLRQLLFKQTDWGTPACGDLSGPSSVHLFSPLEGRE